MLSALRIAIDIFDMLSNEWLNGGGWGGSLEDVKQETYFPQQNYLLELLWLMS